MPDEQIIATQPDGATPTEQPGRDESGRFAPSKDQELAARVQTERYKTELLRDEALSSGLVELDDKMPPEEWNVAFRARMLRHEAGMSLSPTTETVEPETPADVSSNSQEQHRQRSTFESLGLAADHPHVAAAKELVDYYTPAGLDEMMQLSADIPISPGMAKQLVALDNSVDVILALNREPHVLYALTQQTPRQCAATLKSISATLASESGATTAAQTKAPQPISPVRRSTPTDKGLHDGLSNEGWGRRFRKMMNYGD